MSSGIIYNSGYSFVMETVFGLFSFWDDLTQGSIDWETYKLIPDVQKNLYHAGSWRIAEKYGKTFNDQADVSGIWVADISYLGDKPSSAKMFVYDEDGDRQFDAPSSWAIPYIATLNKPQSFTEVGSLEILDPTAFSDGKRAFSKLVDEGADDAWFGMSGTLSSDVITGKVLDANWHGHVSTGISEPSNPYDGFKSRGVRETWDSYESQFDYEKVTARPYAYLANFSIDRSVLKEVDDYGFADIVSGLSEYGVVNELSSGTLQTADALLGIDESRISRTLIQIRRPAKFKKKYAQRVDELVSTDSTIKILSKDFPGNQSPSFAVARSKKDFKRLQKSDANFIYFRKKGCLYFDENASGAKMGRGGIIAAFKGRPAITSLNMVFD